MGFIKLSAFRREEQLEKEEKPTRNKKDEVEHIERLPVFDTSAAEGNYPFLPETMKDADLPFIPATEVAKWDGEGPNRLWIVIDDIVLDVTEYVDRHPGGRQIILGFGGHDCGWQWWSLHGRQIWESIAAGLRVGRTKGVENKHERPLQRLPSSKLGFNDWD